jgi:uncharacterized protein YfbU (UPF0304 family)
MVQLEHPQETAPEYTNSQPTIEQKVRDALLMVDSGHESEVEWEYIQRVYSRLQEMKPTRRVVNLMEMIHPVLAKYGRIEEPVIMAITKRRGK